MPGPPGGLGGDADGETADSAMNGGGGETPSSMDNGGLGDSGGMVSVSGILDL